VRWADEIIVVDMHSSDGTPAICRRYPNVRFFQRDDYIYGNMNFGFDQAGTDWTMRLDSDERVTPELAAEIADILRDPPAGVNGFFFWQTMVVLGHALRYGRGLDLRREMMFRTGHVRYKVEHEHESLPTDHTWRQLRGHYLHYTYTSISQYLAKTEYYTARDVERLTPSVRPPLRGGIVEPLRQVYFLYLKRRGFKDGWHGLLDAGMQAVYQFVLWAKMQERYELLSHSNGSHQP
jgi:glycosyltransferase involved in cell wall biosynthesis